MANLQTREGFESMYAALQELGLTENEQRLYVTSLVNGPTSIATLATQLGLPRPNLYKIIDGLAEKGLVDRTVHARYSRSFMVEAPSKISELLRNKRQTQAATDHAFIEQLPRFLAQFRQGEGPLKIKILIGQKDFIAAFNQMNEEVEGELWYFGSVTDLSAAIGRNLILHNIGKRVSRKVPTKSLLLPHDRTYMTPQEHKEQLREVRYLEDLKLFVASFHIFSNKLIFWQPKVPMAVLIEDEYLVAMMRSMFLAIWETAKG